MYKTVGWTLFAVWGCVGCRCQDAPKATKTSQSAAATDELSASTGQKTVAGDPAAYKKARRTDVVRLETTRGEILVDVYRELAPKSAERFITLVKAGFYNGVAFHEAADGIVVRAGISPNPMVNTTWRKRPTPRDPLIQGNIVGSLALCGAGGDPPTTEFIINLKDSPTFDKQGVTPFGRVRDMQTADQIAFGTEDTAVPDLKRLKSEGYTYLKQNFPKLDYIVNASVLPAE